MPTLLRWRDFTSTVVSRTHVHAIKSGAQAKFWLSDCSLVKSVGFPDHELRRLAGKVRDERETFLEVWNDLFGRR